MSASRGLGILFVLIAALVLALPAQAVAAADVSTSIEVDPVSLRLGEEVTVTVTATNGGPDQATDVNGTSTFGSEFSFQGFMSITQGSAVSSGTPVVITINFGTLNSGASASVVYKLKAAEAGQGTVSGSMATSASDPNLDNNAAEVIIPVTAMALAPSEVSFGQVEVGRIGSPRTLTVTNGASIPLEISGVTVGGAAGDDFLKSTDQCTGVTLGVDASCTISLRYAPSGEGVRTASLTVASSTPGATAQVSVLSGVGMVAQPPRTEGPPPRTEEPPPDTEVSIAIVGRRLVMTRKGVVRPRLRCPKAEASPPCIGQLRLVTARKVPFRGRRQTVNLGQVRFRIGAGATGQPSIRVAPRKAKLIRRIRQARVVRVIVRVRDQAGNSARVGKAMRLRLR